MEIENWKLIKVFLKELFLTGFRNYNQNRFEFSDGINLVLGPNASGKTNLLEAVYLLSTGESFRAGRVSQMINYQEPIAHIRAVIKDTDREVNLASVISRGEVNGQKIPLRKFSINGANKSQKNFVGCLLAVLFSPQNLDIITDSPSFRRQFLNEVLIQVDREYYRAYLSFQKGVRARNRILEQIHNRRSNEKALFFWDRLLLENGQLIIEKRRKLIDFINQQEKSLAKYRIIYQPSIISPKKLILRRQDEIAAGQTLFGPHRDDFFVFDNNHDLAIFGSRGEQRLSVLWLKLGQLKFLEQAAGKRPVLLLDDIFSELDEEHKRLVVANIVGGYQSLITSAEPVSLDYQTDLIKLP